MQNCRRNYEKITCDPIYILARTISTTIITVILDNLCHTLAFKKYKLFRQRLKNVKHIQSNLLCSHQASNRLAMPSPGIE